MKNVIYFIIISLILGVIASIEWLVVCGIFKLICLCFALTFTFPTATGIWLILILLQLFLRPRRDK